MTRPLFLALGAVAALAMSSVSGLAAAQSLRDHEEVNRGLMIIAAGDMIQRNCPTIVPRMIKAYFYARSLERMAKNAGFSDDEIEEFVEDKAEKARVFELAKAYLISKGLDPDRPETYCEVGLYEIERNSQIGVLLKAK